MQRIQFYVLGFMVALGAASVASMGINGEPRTHVAFKGADEAQTQMRAATEQIIERSTADTNELIALPTTRTADIQRSVKRISVRSKLVETCELRRLQMGGLPDRPFVVACETKAVKP